MLKNFKDKIKIHYGKYGAILTAVCALLIFSDLLTKYLEEKFSWNFTVIPKIIWVESGIRNNGAAFGSFGGGQAFLITVTVIMILVIIAAFLLFPNRFKVLKFAFAMILAGAIGNLVDRIAFGEVRDFVWLNMIFTDACCNFADFWIVLGAILALIDVLFLNEFALIPLTATAKQAQKKREEEELLKSAEQSTEKIPDFKQSGDQSNIGGVLENKNAENVDKDNSDKK